MRNQPVPWMFVLLFTCLLTPPTLAQEKAVFAMDKELLRNSRIQPYQHVTSAWLHERIENKYQLEQTSTERFQKWLDSERPARTMIQPIDIESPRIGKPGTEEFNQTIEQYTQILQMMREQTPHQPVIIYGGMHRSYWNPLYYHRYCIEMKEGRSENYHKWREAYENWQIKNMSMARRINPLVDGIAIPLYIPYRSMEDWRIGADACLREMRRCYPDKRVYAWLQPNYTAPFYAYPAFRPLELDRWNDMVEWTLDHECCDGIFIFTLEKHRGEAVERAPGWRDVLLNRQ